MITYQKYVKQRMMLCLCVTSMAVASIAFTSNAYAQDVELDRIRAVVNEGVVLDSDLDSAVRFFKQQANSSGQSLPSDDVIEERLLEQLIDREVQRQHARQLGIAGVAAGN